MSRRELLAARPLVCYVTDRHAFGTDESKAAARLLETVERAAHAGVDVVQIREKDLSGRALLNLTEAAFLRAGGAAKIVVNDRLDVALAAGAAGVHLGGASVPVADVAGLRAAGRAPAEFLIGRSCHSVDEALAAERDGADYVIFGPVFATPSKVEFGAPQGVAALAEVCRRTRVAVLAIGGVTIENAHECISAGAAGIAAIRMFQESREIEELVRKLKTTSLRG